MHIQGMVIWLDNVYYFQYHLYKWEENLDKSIYFKNQVLTQTLGGNPVPVITITSLPVSQDSECIDLLSKYRRLYMSRTSTGIKCSVSSLPRSKFEFAQIRSYQGWYSLKILNSGFKLMQVFHWSRQACNYAFLESWDQCLHGRLGSVASYWPVGESQWNIKHVWYFYDRCRPLYPTLISAPLQPACRLT